MNKLEYISFILTWRCNSRCRMCQIWKKTPTDDELTLKEITTIFSDPMVKNIREIILTGGEPFLRTDLFEIITQIYKSTGAIIGITTNGYLSDIITKVVKKCLEINIPLSIYISIDGSTPKVHDHIRGVNGFFAHTFNTLSSLSQLQINHPQLLIGTGLTVNSENIHDIYKTKGLINSLNPKIGFGIRIAENADYFNNNQLDLKYTKDDKKYLLKMLEDLKDGSIDCYYDAIKVFIRSNKYPHYNCSAFKTSIYITPEGHVCSCSKLLNKMIAGDLKRETPSQILNKIDRKKINNCHDCLDACQWSWAQGATAI